MAGSTAQLLLPWLLLLLLLLLARRTSSQETTSEQPFSTTTDRPQNTTDPPGADSRHVWTVLEDGVMEINSFNGTDIPAPDLQEGQYLRIANSVIQTIPEGTFPVDSNITDATLELVNTTIHQWGANTMDSFANVTVTNSTIRQLNSSGLRFRRRCEEAQEYDTVLTFHDTTIGELHVGGVDVERALLQITESTIVALNGGALRLGLGTQFRMVDTKVGALAVNSFCKVCANVVHFERNHLLHVPPHALHFGSSCRKNRRQEPRPEDFICQKLYQSREVTTIATRLPCGSLGWLRDALHSCGSLTKGADRDYSKFRATSICLDRPESVASFLSRRPEPEPEPEEAGQWLSKGAAAGIAVALVACSLVVGVLAGYCCGKARVTSGKHSFRRADSRSRHEGDAGITLPLERVGGNQHSKDTVDIDTRLRESDGRYTTGPERPVSPARPRATTPPPAPPPTEHLQVPQDGPLAQRHGPRPARAKNPQQGRNRRQKGQPATNDQRSQQADTRADRQTYVNPWPQQPADAGQEPLYQNQPPTQQQPQENDYANCQQQQPDEHDYANYQYQPVPEPPDGHQTDKIIYSNLHVG